MLFSAPVYVLKRKAKRLARQTGVALHQALDRVAVQEGYQNWGHLSARSGKDDAAQQVLAALEPGDLCLVAARPGQGKTLLGLELAANASRLGRKGYFFTLDYNERDVAEQLGALGYEPASVLERLVVDTSDEISAEHIAQRLRTDNQPALIVIDYLQILDQKRSNPSLDHQVRSLCAYAKETEAMCVLISQVDRSFDLSGRAMPSLADLRLPNPVDLSAFSRCVFLNDGKIRLDQAA